MFTLIFRLFLLKISSYHSFVYPCAGSASLMSRCHLAIHSRSCPESFCFLVCVKTISGGRCSGFTPKLLIWVVHSRPGGITWDAKNQAWASCMQIMYSAIGLPDEFLTLRCAGDNLRSDTQFDSC